MLHKMNNYVFAVCAGICILFVSSAKGQAFDINLSAVDAMDIKPQNVFNYSIYSPADKAIQATVKGVISYRNANHRLSYSFNYTLQPGLNTFSADQVNAHWEYSSSAIRDLFVNYNLLPQGTYQYCVTVVAENKGEAMAADQTECLYRQSADIFLINLMEPENDAKIYEYNPMLSWIVTYPFANELTYKIRVAEVKQGQNNYNAVTRNNPIYSESNLFQTSIVYPIYAKQLKAHQPYAWTVDAYYRGVLLGGAEPWRFTIVEDSLNTETIPSDISYLDINKEKRPNRVFAIGKLKLKYTLRNIQTDSLSLILRQNGAEIKLKNAVLKAKHGVNKYDIDFTEENKLKNLKLYELEIRNTLGEIFIVTFKYVNPDQIVR